MAEHAPEIVRERVATELLIVLVTKHKVSGCKPVAKLHESPRDERNQMLRLRQDCGVDIDARKLSVLLRGTVRARAPADYQLARRVAVA